MPPVTAAAALALLLAPQDPAAFDDPRLGLRAAAPDADWKLLTGADARALNPAAAAVFVLDAAELCAFAACELARGVKTEDFAAGAAADVAASLQDAKVGSPAEAKLGDRTFTRATLTGKMDGRAFRFEFFCTRRGDHVAYLALLGPEESFEKQRAALDKLAGSLEAKEPKAPAPDWKPVEAGEAKLSLPADWVRWADGEELVRFSEGGVGVSGVLIRDKTTAGLEAYMDRLAQAPGLKLEKRDGTRITFTGKHYGLPARIEVKIVDKPGAKYRLVLTYLDANRESAEPLSAKILDSLQ